MSLSSTSFPKHKNVRRFLLIPLLMAFVGSGIMGFALPSLAAASSPYESTVLGSSDLISYWRLGETSGTTAVDAMGNHDGTYVGGPTLGVPGLIAGDAGTAIGIVPGQYVDLGTSTDFDLHTGSLAIWFKTPNAGSAYRYLFARPLAYALLLQDNVLEGYTWPGYHDLSTGVNVADNLVHMAVLTFDDSVSGGAKVYVDGVLQFTGDWTPANYDHSLRIGDGDWPDTGLTTTVGQAAIWGRVLPGSEVGALYASGSPAGPPTAAFANTTPAPGAYITMSGDNWDADTSLSFTCDPHCVIPLSDASADSNGHFDGLYVDIPTDLTYSPSGTPFTVTASGLSGGAPRTADALATVTWPVPTAAFNGNTPEPGETIQLSGTTWDAYANLTFTCSPTTLCDQDHAAWWSGAQADVNGNLGPLDVIIPADLAGSTPISVTVTGNAGYASQSATANDTVAATYVPTSYILSGTVSTSSGSLEGAFVYAFNAATNAAASSSASDALGYYELDLPLGVSYKLFIQPNQPGYPDQWRSGPNILLNADTTADISLATLPILPPTSGTGGCNVVDTFGTASDQAGLGAPHQTDTCNLTWNDPYLYSHSITTLFGGTAMFENGEGNDYQPILPAAGSLPMDGSFDVSMFVANDPRAGGTFAFGLNSTTHPGAPTINVNINAGDGVSSVQACLTDGTVYPGQTQACQNGNKVSSTGTFVPRVVPAQAPFTLEGLAYTVYFHVTATSFAVTVAGQTATTVTLHPVDATPAAIGSMTDAFDFYFWSYPGSTGANIFADNLFLDFAGPTSSGGGTPILPPDTSCTDPSCAPFNSGTATIGSDPSSGWTITGEASPVTSDIFPFSPGDDITFEGTWFLDGHFTDLQMCYAGPSGNLCDPSSSAIASLGAHGGLPIVTGVQPFSIEGVVPAGYTGIYLNWTVGSTAGIVTLSYGPGFMGESGTTTLDVSASITLSDFPAAIDFGSGLPGATVTETFALTVLTNNNAGYTLKFQASDMLGNGQNAEVIPAGAMSIRADATANGNSSVGSSATVVTNAYAANLGSSTDHSLAAGDVFDATIDLLIPFVEGATYGGTAIAIASTL